MSTENFISELEYEVRSIEEILSGVEKLNSKTLAAEILQWMIKNVEMFIDSQQRFYRLDLIVEDTDPEDGVKMTETRELQTLFRAIQDEDEKSIECRSVLNRFVSGVLKEMQSNIDLLNQLFKRMIYFYEVQCIYKDEMIERELIGEVDIPSLDYEAFSMGVRVTDTHSGDIVKNYVVPEGLSMEFEIAFREVEDPTNLF